MTILRRLDCVLAPTKPDVLTEWRATKDGASAKLVDVRLRKKSPSAEPAPSQGRQRCGGSSCAQPSQTTVISPNQALVKRASLIRSVNTGGA